MNHAFTKSLRWGAALLTLLLACQPHVGAEISTESFAEKYSRIFSSFPPESDDGLDRLAVYSQFIHEVPKKQRAAVLLHILSGKESANGMKEFAVMECQRQGDPPDRPSAADLKSKFYALQKHPQASVRRYLLYWISENFPSDHQVIESFLEDADDDIRAYAVGLIADWPEGKKTVSKYYELKKADKNCRESVRVARVRLGL